MATITIDTDQLIETAVELEREKASVLARISEHRENVRRAASMTGDSEFGAFSSNFYPQKMRGQTRDPEQVKASAQWKRDLLASYGVEEVEDEE